MSRRQTTEKISQNVTHHCNSLLLRGGIPYRWYALCGAASNWQDWVALDIILFFFRLVRILETDKATCWSLGRNRQTNRCDVRASNDLYRINGSHLVDLSLLHHLDHVQIYSCRKVEVIYLSGSVSRSTVNSNFTITNQNKHMTISNAHRRSTPTQWSPVSHGQSFETAFYLFTTINAVASFCSKVLYSHRASYFAFW